MSCIKDNECWDSADYIEEITCYKPTKNLTLEEWEDFKNKYSDIYWNYPLTEIDHIIENEINVVLVRFPNEQGGYDYRFCEIPKED